MNNKYYTPTIEEFHVGFQYEEEIYNANGNPSWYKEVLDWADDLNKIRSDINSNLIRVKYLDRENIESLGFTNVCNNEDFIFESNKTYLGISTGDDRKYYIDYCINRNWMLIYFKSNNGFECQVFDGIIKNISELKKLLSQLNIEYAAST